MGLGIKSRLLWAAHRAAARLGFDLAPTHYYSSFASRRELLTTPAGWKQPSNMVGVQCDRESQIALLEDLSPFIAEAEKLSVFHQASRNGWGQGYGYVEALVLHAVIRHFCPQRIVEVGAGVSTACILQALKPDRQSTVDYTVIEPFPSAALRNTEHVRLIARPVQEVDLRTFTSLREGDFLFVDSSHAVKPGSDVLFEILEILPRLAPGVLVHFHDIFFPYEHQPDLFRAYYQWSETALLHAFLIGNSQASIALCLSWLHHSAPEILGQFIETYQPRSLVNGLYTSADGHFPSSTYIRIMP